MKEQELLNNIFKDGGHKRRKIPFWNAMESIVPHLYNSMCSGSGKEISMMDKRAVIEYMVAKDLFMTAGEERYFSDNNIGIIQGTQTFFYSFKLAREFFIEAGFLNQDGTELEYIS